MCIRDRSKTVARYVSLKFATNIEEVDVVSETEINNWIDTRAWDGENFAALGRGVNADFVLGINMDNYTIREGQTIFKGRADVTVKVIDVATNLETFQQGPTLFEYPENGRPALNTSERKFEAFYLAWLTQRIARTFYKHDGLEDMAEDAAFSG